MRALGAAPQTMMLVSWPPHSKHLLSSVETARSWPRTAADICANSCRALGMMSGAAAGPHGGRRHQRFGLFAGLIACLSLELPSASNWRCVTQLRNCADGLRQLLPLRRTALSCERTRRFGGSWTCSAGSDSSGSPTPSVGASRPAGPAATAPWTQGGGRQRRRNSGPRSPRHEGGRGRCRRRTRRAFRQQPVPSAHVRRELTRQSQ